MSGELVLRPLAFHEALADALQELEPGLWQWFSSDDFGQKYADTVKVELLRSTYRLPRESNVALYAAADEVARALGVTVPVSLYQAQEVGTLNAGLIYVPSEAHVVLRGPVRETLTELELRALLGHELAHHRLWTEASGRLKTADSLIEYMVGQPSCAPSHVHSALRHRRWTEVYADRGSLVACGELWPAIACLVKMSTGLRDVDPRAYLAQAEEAIASKARASESDSHPEGFIRAFALKCWHSGEDEERVRALVEGPRDVPSLDLLQQRQLMNETLELLRVILQPDWMRTDATLSHACRFFPDAVFSGQPASVSLRGDSPSVSEYLAYLLLDFGMADPDLEDHSLAFVAHLGRQLGLQPALSKIVRKELRMTAASYADLEKRGSALANPSNESSTSVSGVVS